jgi:hypothetical protein
VKTQDVTGAAATDCTIDVEWRQSSRLAQTDDGNSGQPCVAWVG